MTNQNCYLKPSIASLYDQYLWIWISVLWNLVRMFVAVTIIPALYQRARLGSSFYRIIWICLIMWHTCNQLINKMNNMYKRFLVDIKGRYTFSSSNLWNKFSQCYYIVTRECHISSESLCRELSKFTHYFDLVAMATLLALWLAKHGNGCNS